MSVPKSLLRTDEETFQTLQGLDLHVCAEVCVEDKRRNVSDVAAALRICECRIQHCTQQTRFRRLERFRCMIETFVVRFYYISQHDFVPETGDPGTSRCRKRV